MSGSEGVEGSPERDETPGTPRPDPLDRPWVHPSELRSYVANPLPPVQTRPREWVIGVVSAMVGAAATVLVLVAFGVLGERTRSPLPPPIPTNANTAIDFAVAARVGQAVEPSIVTVRAVVGDATTVTSGVAVKSDRVLTTAHALLWATAVTVVTSDGRTVTAKIMGSDVDTDLAVLDVSGADLQYRALAIDDPGIGQPVVAVAVSRNSSPFVAPNVISRRNVLVTTNTGAQLAGLLQANIPTAPETSGGGLFDSSGRLVGILMTPPGVVDDGLAVPIRIADDMREQIEASGKVTRAWLGLTAVDTDRSGAKVTAVVPGSPAAEAKLEVGDVIYQAGGQPVGGVGDLVAQWRFKRPADQIVLGFRRGQTTHSARVTLTSEPAPAPEPAPEPEAADAAPTSG